MFQTISTRFAAFCHVLQLYRELFYCTPKKKKKILSHITHVEYDIRRCTVRRGTTIISNNNNHNLFRGATKGGEEAKDEQESNEKRKAPISVDGV